MEVNHSGFIPGITQLQSKGTLQHPWHQQERESRPILFAWASKGKRRTSPNLFYSLGSSPSRARLQSQMENLQMRLQHMRLALGLGSITPGDEEFEWPKMALTPGDRFLKGRGAKRATRIWFSSRNGTPKSPFAVSAFFGFIYLGLVQKRGQDNSGIPFDKPRFGLQLPRCRPAVVRLQLLQAGAPAGPNCLLLWMDEILHHPRSHENHCLLGIYRGTII